MARSITSRDGSAGQLASSWASSRLLRLSRSALGNALENVRGNIASSRVNIWLTSASTCSLGGAAFVWPPAVCPAGVPGVGELLADCLAFSSVIASLISCGSMRGSSGGGGAQVVAQPVGQLGVPGGRAMGPAGVGVVGGELGQLVRGRLGVGRQAGTLAGHGQLLGIGLPVQGHRVAAGLAGRRGAVVSLLSGTLENRRARARERVGVRW